MNLTANSIAKIVEGELRGDGTREVHHISVNTKSIVHQHSTLFAALPGKISDGHQYIAEAIDMGVMVFLVREDSDLSRHGAATFIEVNDVLTALQHIAKYHCSLFDLPIIAITGSNGKTIIKEWLYQLLYDDYRIVKSPKSYNSQIGVPLSLFNIEEEHDLAIIEAGISQPGEMMRHQQMIDPTIGIFTNIGDAHSSGFNSIEHKVSEKAKLFHSCNTIIYCADHKLIAEYIEELYSEKELLSWSSKDPSHHLYYQSVVNDSDQIIKAKTKNGDYDFDFAYSDRSSLENIFHCITLMLHLGIGLKAINEKISRVSGLAMRLEMKSGLNGCTIINDAYSADLSALEIALEFMQQQSSHQDKDLVITPLEQSGMSEKDAIGKIEKLCNSYQIQTVHYISDFDGGSPTRFINYKSKQDFLDKLVSKPISDKMILVKGARSAMLEDVVYRLSYKGHSTRLTINLDAIAHNVRVYKSLLKPETEIIAVIKASAYGTGSVEVARLLARNGVTYLAVAFVDEAISLRNQGVNMPIIVFNADAMSFRDVVTYDLQLEVYGLEQLQQLHAFAKRQHQTIGIHLKLDTGMHRLGFTPEQLEVVCPLICDSCILVDSVFSHLASSEDSSDDSYTLQQFAEFDRMYESITGKLGYRPRRHILNSSGITRFSDRQYDMVRLGLGLYGVDGSDTITKKLQKVHSLTSTVLQIKQLKAGDSVGYNRKTVLEKDTLTAVVNVGYADGLVRNLGNRTYSVVVNGRKAQIIGIVSMDLIIIDLSNAPKTQVGNSVIIFDESHSIENMAAAAGTIPYEILSRISERVERVYIRS